MIVAVSVDSLITVSWLPAMKPLHWLSPLPSLTGFDSPPDCTVVACRASVFQLTLIRFLI
jgi:hypothetical protein